MAHCWIGLALLLLLLLPIVSQPAMIRYPMAKKQKPTRHIIIIAAACFRFMSLFACARHAKVLKEESFPP